jgi:hypothetical protein
VPFSLSRARAPFLALVATILLVLTLAAPAAAAGPTGDDGGLAIGRVRDALRARGRTAGGPMIAAPLRPDAPPEEAGRAWMVISEDGIWLVWGAVSGPLAPDEARLLLGACLCDAALPAPVGPSGRPATRSV